MFSPTMSFVNTFDSTFHLSQDENGSSPRYRNDLQGRYFQPLDELDDMQISKGFAVGDRLRLRIRSLEGVLRYTNVVVRNIISYTTAKSALGSYNEHDAYFGEFYKVLVLYAI